MVFHYPTYIQENLYLCDLFYNTSSINAILSLAFIMSFLLFQKIIGLLIWNISAYKKKKSPPKSLHFDELFVF